jgi:hypothetical protein
MGQLAAMPFAPPTLSNTAQPILSLPCARDARTMGTNGCCREQTTAAGNKRRLQGMDDGCREWTVALGNEATPLV